MKHDKSIKDSGGKGEVIILLPGFPASLKYWSSTQRFLVKSGYRVISIDLLGQGSAPKPKNNDYSYNDHVNYIHNVILKLDLGKDVSFIGHSMGALLAARYASKYPLKVSRLMLLNPPLYLTPDEAYKTLRNTGRLYRLMLDSKYRGIAWMFVRTLSLGLIASHTQSSRDRSLKRIIESAELFDDLKDIETSTLILVGAKDRPQYLKNIESKRFKNNIHVNVENVTHHSVIFYKDLVRPLMLDFLKV